MAEQRDPIVVRLEGAEEGRPSDRGAFARYRLLQLGLFVLRLGPALILLFLVIGVALTTPVFTNSRNIGNVLSQSAVLSVLALGQLLVIVTRGIELSVGSTPALSSVVGAIVFAHGGSSLLVILAILGTGAAVGLSNGLVPHGVEVIGDSRRVWLPNSTFVVLGFALFMFVLTTFVVWGRWLYAVGGNPEAPRRTGVPVKRVLICRRASGS